MIVKSGLPTYLSRQQVRQLFAVITGLRDRALFSLIYFYGLRVSEACSLDRADLEARSRTPHFPRRCRARRALRSARRWRPVRQSHIAGGSTTIRIMLGPRPPIAALPAPLKRVVPRRAECLAPPCPLESIPACL